MNKLLSTATKAPESPFGGYLGVILATALLACCTLAAHAGDTLRVATARLAEPAQLRTVFTTDTTTLGGKKLDANEILKNNAALAKRRAATETTTVIDYGTALPQGTLSTIRFTIDADRFAKATLDAAKIKNRAVYLDGQEATGELRLKPGRHEVTLLAYSPQEATDTFALQLTGKDLSHLTLNPTTPRLFDVDINVHGERFGDVSLSPSGRYVVTHYANTLHGGEVIWRTTLTDLQTNRTLYAGEYHRFNWLEHRDIIYYTRKSAEGLQLLYLDPSDMKETLVATGLPDGQFTMSPDESFLLISKDNKGPQPKGALKSLYDSDDRMPGWRDRKDQYIYDLRSGVLQRLTFGKESCWVNDIRPDSQRLLLSLRRHDATRAPMDHTTIFEMDLLTGRVDTLINDAPWIGSCQYSPDGRQLLVTGNGGAFDGIGNEVSPGQHAQDFFYTLFLYDIDSKRATHLLPNFKPNVSAMRWSEADGLIYLTCEDGYNRNLWTLHPTTLERQRIDLPVSYVSRYSFSRTKNPRLVFYGQTATTSRDAFITTLGGKVKPYKDEVTYGTNIVRGDTIPCPEMAYAPQCRPFGEISSASLYPDLRVPQAAEWSFRATRGDQIKGFYFLPADFDPSTNSGQAQKHYPMIVYYYGGCSPTARILEYAYPIAALANMGYVTLVLEPSGATGFGQEFAARHVNTWGLESGDDIIEGVKTFCAEHPFVDASKIGCMGASYGGFMTQYLQTRTDIFACAISHAGISNITSYWGGGYWGYSYGECAEYGSFPWNNPDLFTKQSPLFNADKIHTPLLLLHGTVDTNVPTTESQQLYNALKILGREVSYIQVDGENHIINDYKKRQEWSEAIYAWFAKYLQNEPAWWDDLGF